MANLDAHIRERLRWDTCDEQEAIDILLDDALDAIRAVLDLHAPEETRHWRKQDRHLVCTECVYEESSSRVVYPCDTVRAIAAAMGVQP